MNEPRSLPNLDGGTAGLPTTQIVGISDNRRIVRGGQSVGRVDVIVSVEEIDPIVRHLPGTPGLIQWLRLRKKLVLP